LFTYYMGQDLIAQMGDGMKVGVRHLKGTHPKIQLEGGFRAPDERRTQRKLDVSVDMRWDRDRVVKEMAYDAYTKGY
jgi:hypothetical protein